MGNSAPVSVPSATKPPDQFSASILIVDDHAAVRAGLRTLISTRAGWVICGEAADGEEAVNLALKLKPSVIIMDISLPGIDGLEATRRIRQQMPGAEVVVVSQHDSDQVVWEAQQAGARGFVVKSHLSADLLPALEAALLHSSRISAPVAKAWQDAILTHLQPAQAQLTDPGPHDDLDLMSGGGEMGTLMRSHNWSQTPFGPVSTWPQSLRTALRICLDSRFPIVIFWGRDLRLFYNDSYLPALGSTKHPQALGARGVDVWHEIWDTVGHMLEGVMRTGHATWEDDQMLLINRRGYVEETYWTYSYSAIRLPSGEVGGVFCAVHEGTERVLSARRMKTLREVAYQVVQAKNPVDACNLAMQSIMRNPADCPFATIHLIEDGQAFLTCASFDERPQLFSFDLSVEDRWAIRETVRSRTPQVFELQDREILPGAPYGDKCREAISLPILGTSREVIAVLTIGITPYCALDELYRDFFESLTRNLAANINNAQAYEDERKRAEALAELDRAKTVFFSNVSHEFRTPLTLMLGPLEDMLASTYMPEEQRAQLEVAHRNSLRLLKLVNTLLDFSRLEAGRIEASYEPTDLAKFTAELASVFRSAAERAGLELAVKCETISEPVYVDREMWEKIVLNLLSNAFKFTFTGEIEVSLRRIHGTVEFEVRDTGTGIPERELPHLFERFYRVKGAQGRTFEGSGIGLALVQELARLHGGSVRVKSEFGKGSTFVVSIPLGKSHLPADRIGTARTLQSTGVRSDAYLREALHWLPGEEAVQDDAVPLLAKDEPLLTRSASAETPAYILLADDNSDMQEYVRRLLGVQYEVHAVGDGEAALQSARERQPDLILSDIMMPRRDGFALLEAVRSDPSLKYTPVILLSARAGEESRMEGLQSGADDYLVKPFTARELLARVKSHLSMSQLRLQTGRQLDSETEALSKLNEYSLRLWRSKTLQEGLDEIIASTIKLLGANKGTLQLLDQDRGVLRIVSQMGFDAEFLKCFREVRATDDCACGRAIRTGSTLTIEDTEQDETFAPFRTAARAADYRSVISTPLVGASGKILGVLSCHFHSPHRANRQELHRLDLFVRQGANFIQRCNTEEALKQSEESFRAIVDTTPECVKLVAADGTILYINPSGQQMMGAKTVQEIIGKSIYEVIAPADRERFRAFDQQVRDGKKGSLGYSVITSEGSVRDMESYAAPFSRADGNVVHLAVTRDITERNEAAKALARQRDRFDLVTKASQIGFWFCDLPFDKLTWDERVKEHFWLAPDAEVSIDTFYDCLHPEDKERTRQQIEYCTQNDKAYDIEYRTVAPDGRQKWIRAIGRTSYDPNREPVRFDGITLDITGRKQAEEREQAITAETVASKAKFQAVFEQTTQFAGIMTKDGALIEANRMSLDACGYKAEDVLGRPFWETRWWQNSPESQWKIRAGTALAASGVPYRESLYYSLADGTQRLVDFALYPIVDEHGKVIFLHPTGVDITELKRTEEKNQKLTESLEAEVLARTRELEERNTDILIQAERLRELSWYLLRAQDEERRHIARELHDSAGQTLTILGIRLAQLIQKATRNAPELAKDAEAIEESVRLLQREIRTTSYLLHPPLLDESGLNSALSWYTQGVAERSGMDISLEIPESVGRLPREMELVMFRVVQECLTNIHRHSGSKTALIRVARENGRIVLTVKDEGGGMSPERLKEIHTGGAGVGIRGIRERLRQFGGDMEIESSRSGTQVRMTIPIPNDRVETAHTGAGVVQAASG
jgi:PAS domain S-box-containing protein